MRIRRIDRPQARPIVIQPVAQQALSDVALADDDRFALFIPNPVDSLGVWSRKFDPGLAPGVSVGFGLDHVVAPGENSVKSLLSGEPWPRPGKGAPATRPD